MVWRQAALEARSAAEAEFERLVQQHCDPVRAKAVRQFARTADRKRALASTLLQRKACCDLAGVPPAEIVLGRTYGNKPYGVVPYDPSRPNFNFNPSHDGDFTVL